MTAPSLPRSVHRGALQWLSKLFVVLGAVAITGCSSVSHVVCTEMGAPAGISVTIEAEVAQGISDEVSLEVSWASSTEPQLIELSLYAETEAVDEGCVTQDTDDGDLGICSATMRETAGKVGFADIPELPATSVTVATKLTDLNGEPLLVETVTVTPTETFPNGPECPAGGVQASITIDAHGAFAR